AAGDRVAEAVLDSDRYSWADRRSGHGIGWLLAEGEPACGRGADADRVGGAGNAAGDGVGSGDGLAAGCSEGDATGEGVCAGVAGQEGVVGGQAGLTVRGSEVDGAGVGGDGVGELVLGSDRRAQRRTRGGGAGRGPDGQAAGEQSGDGDAA